MATIEHVWNKDLYTNNPPYGYDKILSGNNRSYYGTVVLPAGLTQKNGNNFPLIHAKDVQIGIYQDERLNDKLAYYDAILREIYGRTPAELEALDDGRSEEALNDLGVADGIAGETGIDSISRIADILNNRTETIDDRIVDLRIFDRITVSQSNAVTSITTNTATILADNNADTITIAAGNKWIMLAADASSDTITIGHMLSALSAGAHASNWQTNYLTTKEIEGQVTQVPTEQTPNFGEIVSFVVPAISFNTDEAGHVVAFSESYIQPLIRIPIGSIGDTDKGSKNVMTGLSLTASTMTFNREWSYLADLLLTNYSYAINGVTLATRPSGQTDRHTIAATDTLTQALAKLQSYAVANHNAIEQEVTDRGTAITNLIDSAGTNFNTLGKIEIAVTTHTGDTNNPHSVTAAQLNLDNLTNHKQVKAIQSSTDGNIALWDGTTGDLLKVSTFTIGTSVPEGAVFTDTTYEQADDETLGLVRLYDTTGDHEDGTMTQAAIVDAIDTAIGNILSSFEDLTLKMPNNVVWQVDEETGILTASVTQYASQCEIQIEKFEDPDWNPVTDPAPMAGEKFRANVTRTLQVGNAEYSNTEVVGAEYIEPEQEEEP